MGVDIEDAARQPAVPRDRNLRRCALSGDHSKASKYYNITHNSRKHERHTLNKQPPTMALTSMPGRPSAPALPPVPQGGKAPSAQLLWRYDAAEATPGRFHTREGWRGAVAPTIRLAKCYSCSVVISLCAKAVRRLMTATKKDLQEKRLRR